jgi:hypothetical protein
LECDVDSLFALQAQSQHSSMHGDSLSGIWIIVMPAPVNGLLSGVQLNESTRLVVLALSIFLVPLVSWAGSGHHGNRCSKGGSL